MVWLVPALGHMIAVGLQEPQEHMATRSTESLAGTPNQMRDPKRYGRRSERRAAGYG